LSQISEMLRAALALDQLDVITSNLASFTSAVVLSGMEYEGQREGRDPQRAVHGLLLDYRAWVA
jgi:hypothetical protein